MTAAKRHLVDSCPGRDQAWTQAIWWAQQVCELGLPALISVERIPRCHGWYGIYAERAPAPSGRQTLHAALRTYRRAYERGAINAAELELLTLEAERALGGEALRAS